MDPAIQTTCIGTDLGTDIHSSSGLHLIWFFNVHFFSVFPSFYYFHLPPFWFFLFTFFVPFVFPFFFPCSILQFSSFCQPLLLLSFTTCLLPHQFSPLLPFFCPLFLFPFPYFLRSPSSLFSFYPLQYFIISSSHPSLFPFFHPCFRPCKLFFLSSSSFPLSPRLSFPFLVIYLTEMKLHSTKFVSFFLLSFFYFYLFYFTALNLQNKFNILRGR